MTPVTVPPVAARHGNAGRLNSEFGRVLGAVASLRIDETRTESATTAPVLDDVDFES